MQVLYCWRCRVEIPMLEDDEFRVVQEHMRRAEQEGRPPLEPDPDSDEPPRDPVYQAGLDAYEQITGVRETVFAAMMHHVVSGYGPPCFDCGRPLRTHQAHLCGSCMAPRVAPVETPRLLLQPWRRRDGEPLQRLLSDPAVRGRRDLPRERIARLADHSVRQWRVNGFGPWAAIEKATGAWIGRIGLDELEDWPGPDRIEVGFELHPAWWGRGLATEGALAALAFGFAQHGLRRIISVTAAGNAAARRVMEKAGLTYQGTRPWKNPDVPVVWYAIDRSAWRARS
jgi:RimJ/RimL family protein N-acetyltransferase